MAVYPLQPLLAVRQYRENAAQTRLRQAERAAREAQDILAQREKEHERYQLWRVAEEDRRYTAIMGQLLSLDDLDRFKAGLAQLRDEELLREEDVLKARKNLDAALSAVADAKLAVRTAQRETARIVAHKDIWLEEARKEAERKEDLESEEFKPLPVGAAGEI